MARSKFWRLGLAYWSLRARALHALRRHSPAPAKAVLRRLRRRRLTPGVVPGTPPALQLAAEIDDFYSALTLLPRLDPLQTTAIVANETLPKQRRPDVVCFSIIDWSFRYQRPQQIMSQFAAQGHRVFYINLAHHLSITEGVSFKVQRIKNNVYELFLAAPRALDVYSQVLAGQDQHALLEGLDSLRHAFDLAEAVAYVMVPSWGEVALEACQRWGWQLVYDCMDEWENFPGIGRALVEMEPRLVETCDLLVVSAQRLYDRWFQPGRPIVLARNAVDFEFFAERLRPNDLLGEPGRPIIGYYGAIADWFDVDLLRFVAERRPEYRFVLLGGVFNVDVASLEALPNVQFLGQQPYETMPGYLYHFDVCLIPFKVNPITHATDPVKLYEYLSAGKPVVAVTLAELELYGEHLYLAEDQAAFLARLDEAVAENDPERVERRRALARENTWAERYQRIAAGLRRQTARASIVIVTYNNLALTRLCLESLVRNTAYAHYEVIVVDNHSTDGTAAYLQTFAARFEHAQIVLNQENLGFARANNQGLALATGEYLVLLNNDTIVPPGWLERLLYHLRDETIGLIGPMTNFAGNEARLDVDYRTWQEMEAFAGRQRRAHFGQLADIDVLAMYCVAMRRQVYVEVGALDERFGAGLFEDDDYTLRVRQKGYRVVCAPGVFVHHFGQAAFGRLIVDGTYDSLFEANRRYYEEKWQTTWVPHQFGKLTPYAHAVARPIRAAPPPAPETAPLPHLAAAPVDEAYAQQVLREKEKWGQHLQVEASGDWHAWLDHPLVEQHYRERSLLDGQRWEEWVITRLGGPAEKSLDLGCGAGDRSLTVARAGATRHADGIDLSDDRIAAGEQRRMAAGVPGRFWVEDINAVSLPANAYDLIFSCHSFHHFLKLEHILAQVANALTPRGLFILEEFVGPTQFQWTDRQIELTRELLGQLPPPLRRFRDGQLKVFEGRPTPEEVVAVSPFESIRSAEIWPLFQQHFEVVAVRNLGGTLQHLLYNGIVHNFHPDDQQARRHIEAIYTAEDRLIDSGEIPSDFRLLVGRKRSAAPRPEIPTADL
jgi:GT2 family glycosyltransferase/SAM-dependent methyltransferase/glycosyltransferase involved in cell wall biosynthesis